MRTNLHWVETGVTGRLAIMARPRAGDWLEDEVRGLRESGVDIVVSLLTSEEVAELSLQDEAGECAKAGLEFRSFPIPDREVPPVAEAARAFASGLRNALVSGRSIAIHCRMGIGRSSLIAAAVLRLVGVEPPHALTRLSAARGFRVPDTEEQRQWILNFPANS